MPSRRILIHVDGQPVNAREGMTIAAALSNAGVPAFRRSMRGEPRAPLCGMGVCMECRLIIDGRAQQRSCQRLCVDGMEVRTA